MPLPTLIAWLIGRRKIRSLIRASFRETTGSLKWKDKHGRPKVSFVFNASFELPEDIAEAFVAEFNREHVVRQLPSKSGFLRSSIGITQRGRSVRIYGATYAPYVSFQAGLKRRTALNIIFEEAHRSLVAVTS